MTQIVGVLEHLPPLLVLAVAVALVLGETAVLVGLFFPVEITLLFVGFLSYLGEVPFVPVFLLMLAAALAGDALALRSGRKYGPRVRASRFGARVGEHRWVQADRILHRLGGRSAFIARWVPFVRTLLPRLAGSAGMPYRRFAPWNAAGVVSAVGSSVVLGYLAGASYQQAAERLGRATGAVMLLLVVLVTIVVVGRWLGRHPDPARALGARARDLPALRWLGRRYGAAWSSLADRVGPVAALLLNLVAGLALLFAIGVGLSWLVQLWVEHSGLSGVDAAIAGWFADHRTEEVADLAVAAAKLLGGTVLVAAVAAVALVLAARRRRLARAAPSGGRGAVKRPRRGDPGVASDPSGGRGAVKRPRRGDLVEVIGTAGAFVPLVVLAVAADLAGGDPASRPVSAVGVFSTQTTVATAGWCTLVWLLTRHRRWPTAVTGWTIAVVGIVVHANARLYLGWNTASETVTAVLLGGLWTAVYMIAWTVRDRGTVPEPPAPISQLSQQPH